MNREHVGRTAHCPDCKTRFAVRQAGDSIIAQVLLDDTGDQPTLASDQSSESQIPRLIETVPCGDGATEVAESISNYQSLDRDGLAPATGVWTVGDVIIDRYEIKQVHESGGMGLVYRATHRQWDTDLAIKSPRPTRFVEEYQKANFERECETWIKLGLHPNIVTCFYVRRIDEIPRVFAEYVEGGSLKELIDGKKLYDGDHVIALRRIIDIAIQFAWGLHFAHEHELVHQDIKPGNLLVTEDGITKVTDFGLAKATIVADASDAPADKVVSFGGMTPAFCSPEQFNQESLTHKTDIWSWALSVLEMFTGRIVWSSGTEGIKSLEDLVQRGCDDPMIPQLPIPMAAILKQCFHPDPARRPSDMKTIADQLAQIYQQTFGQQYPRTQPQTVAPIADVLNNRAISMIDLGRGDEAEDMLKRAVRSQAEHREATFNLGLLRWRRAQQTDQAFIEVLKKAAASSGRPESWKSLFESIDLERASQPGSPCVAALQPTGVNPLCVATSADDARIVVAGTGQAMHELDANTHQPIAAYATSNVRYPYACFIKNGSALLTVDHRGEATAWSNGQRRGNLPRRHSGKLVCATTDPSARFLARLYDDRELELFDIESQQHIDTWSVNHNDPCSMALFCDDNGKRMLMTAGGYQIRVWDLENRRTTINWTEEHARLSCASVSTEAGIIAFGTEDGFVGAIDLASGQARTIRHVHTNRVNAIAIFGDHAVSAGADAMVRLWDTRTGRCIRTMAGHGAEITDVCTTPDGQHAVSISSDSIRWWNLSTAPAEKARYIVCKPKSAREVIDSSALFNQRLNRAVAAAKAGMVTESYQFARSAGEVAGFERSPRLMAILCRLDEAGQRQSLKEVWERGGIETPGATMVALSSQRRVAVWIDHQGAIHVIDGATAKHLHTIDPPTDRVRRVALSADGTRCAIAGDGSMHEVDTESGQVIRSWQAKRGSPSALRYVGQNTLAWADLSGRVMLWKDGEHRPTQLRAPSRRSAAIVDLVCSDDGEYAITVDTRSQITVWHAPNRVPFFSFKEPSHAQRLLLSPGNGYLLIGCRDGSLVVWRIDKEDEVARYHGLGETTAITDMAVSRDGRFAITISADGSVRVRKLPMGDIVGSLQLQHGSLRAAAVAGDANLVLGLTNNRLNEASFIEFDWELSFDAPRVTQSQTKRLMKQQTGVLRDDEIAPEYGSNRWNTALFKRKLIRVAVPIAAVLALCLGLLIYQSTMWSIASIEKTKYEEDLMSAAQLMVTVESIRGLAHPRSLRAIDLNPSMKRQVYHLVNDRREVVPDGLAVIEKMSLMPEKRMRAAFVLCLGEPDFGEDVGNIVAARLDDKEPIVREAAARTLRALGPAAMHTKPQLRTALKDQDKSVRQSAALALTQLGDNDEDVLRALAEVFDHRGIMFRRSAEGTFAAAGEKAVPILLELLNHKEARVRGFAVRSLQRIPSQLYRAAPVFAHRLLFDKEWEYRVYATGVYNEMGPKAIPLLLESMSASSPMTRKGAYTLLTVNLKFSDEQMANAFDEADKPMREGIVHGLLSRAKDEGPESPAAKMLVRIGSPAMPLLIKARDRGNTTATKLIDRIGSK